MSATTKNGQVRQAAIVAVAKTAKQNATNALTLAHRQAQAGGESSPLKGIVKSFEKLNEDDPDQPGQETLVQYTVEDLLATLTRDLGDSLDVVATQEFGNTVVKADVVVDGRTLIEQAPVGYLLYLEKRLTDIHTFVAGLPTLDPAHRWDWNADAGQSGAYASEPVRTRQTKKVPKNHVKAPATDKHPAQVEIFNEDVTTGYWVTMKFSGAVTGNRKRELLDRVTKLQRAVKTAREEANAQMVDQVKVGEQILTYLFSR